MWALSDLQQRSVKNIRNMFQSPFISFIQTRNSSKMSRFPRGVWCVSVSVPTTFQSKPCAVGVKCDSGSAKSALAEDQSKQALVKSHQAVKCASDKQHKEKRNRTVRKGINTLYTLNQSDKKKTKKKKNSHLIER